MSVRALVGMLLLLYSGAALFLYLKQRTFIYFPFVAVEHSFSVEHFSSQGESIEVVVLNKEKQDAIIYFGGNAEAVAASAPDFEVAFPERTIYLVNYRGYGGSTGSPSEQGLYADALQIYDGIIKRHENVSVIGRSIGSGIATFLAARRHVAKLVLVTPFDSLVNVAKDQFPLFPVSFFLKDRFDSYSRVGEIESQTLVVVAGNDAIIGSKYSNRLISAFPPSQVTVKTFAEAGHNSLPRREYLIAMSAFLRTSEP